MNRKQIATLLGGSLLFVVCLQVLRGHRQTADRSASSSSVFSATILRTTLANTTATWKLSEKQSIRVAGESRSYRVYAPEQVTAEPCGVVLLLHGHGSSADQLMGVTGRQAPYRMWMPVAEQSRWILVIPDGLAGSDGKQGWNDARNLPANPVADDVAFLNQLVETIAGKYHVDLKRVFATGTSNGGHMALRLAAETPGKYAAIAAVAAANPKPVFKNAPKLPVSVLFMNGTADRILPYQGGKMIRERGEVQSTSDSMGYWVKHNTCGSTPKTIRYPDRNKADRCTASRTTYRNAKTNVEVCEIQILGGGHAEPSVKQPYSRLFLAVTGRQNWDIEMADEIGDFFLNKSR